MNSGVVFNIPGRPVAKSNNYKIIKVKGYYRIAPNQDIRDYQKVVAESCPDFPMFTCKLSVIITWHRGDKRRKDLDNIAKAIKDGITDGKLWRDDSQVEALLLQSIHDAEGAENEWVRVHIFPKISESCTSNADSVPSALDLGF